MRFLYGASKLEDMPSAQKYLERLINNLKSLFSSGASREEKNKYPFPNVKRYKNNAKQHFKQSPSFSGL